MLSFAVEIEIYDNMPMRLNEALNILTLFVLTILFLFIFVLHSIFYFAILLAVPKQV